MGYGKIPDLGSGRYGAICIVIFEKGVAPKLRRIILLHFGLVTLDLGKPKEPLISMVFGPS